MTEYFGTLVIIFGLSLGSFLNCTAMRLVRGEDFVKGRSRCPKCGHELSALELIPVVSFIIQGGKCRHCKEKISSRYIVSELIFAALALGLYLRFVVHTGFSTEGIILFFRDLVFTGCLFVVALTDLEKLEIFDECLVFGFLNFIVFGLLQLFLKLTDILSLGRSLLAGLVTGAVMLTISLVMDKLLKKESLGGGDIKLFALIGLYLGFYGAYELVILSCALGLLYAGARGLIYKNASKEFPFGPAIALSGYILLLTESFITMWYLSLIYI